MLFFYHFELVWLGGDALLLSFLLNFKNSYVSSVSIRGSLDIENYCTLRLLFNP